jgi:hypothetical protein
MLPQQAQGGKTSCGGSYEKCKAIRSTVTWSFHSYIFIPE